MKNKDFLLENTPMPQIVVNNIMYFLSCVSLIINPVNHFSRIEFGDNKYNIEPFIDTD